jgi:hypothetical protein
MQFLRAFRYQILFYKFLAKIFVFSLAIGFTIDYRTLLYANEPYSVYVVKPITNKRILPKSNMNGYIKSNVLSVTVCSDEYEPASFVIRANEKLTNFKPESSNLKMDKSEIPATNIDIKVVKSWYQGCPNSIHYVYCPGYQKGLKKVLIPELLLNDETLVRVDTTNKINYLKVKVKGVEQYIDITSADRNDKKRGEDDNIPINTVFYDKQSLQPLNINKNENQQFWVTVYVPIGTRSGLYQGAITLTGDNLVSKTIQLNVNVLPFILEKPILEYALYYRGRMSNKFNARIGSEYKTESQLRLEMKNMFEHGVESNTVTQSYYPRDLFEKYLKIRNEVGMKKILYMLWSGTYFENISNAKPLISFAKSYGYYQVYFYGGEELSEEEWERRKALWDQMRKAGGKVFAGHGSPKYAKDLDIAVTSARGKSFSESYHNNNHKIFARSTPQVGVEQPETYRRNYGFYLWQIGYDGVMNYAYQDSWGCIWNDFDGYFRDHVFAYPTTSGIIDTIQWEGFREGVDDIRYLSTLLNAIKKAKEHGISTKSAEKWLSKLNTSGDIDEIRLQIVNYILAFKRQLD